MVRTCAVVPVATAAREKAVTVPLCVQLAVVIAVVRGLSVAPIPAETFAEVVATGLFVKSRRRCVLKPDPTGVLVLVLVPLAKLGTCMLENAFSPP